MADDRTRPEGYGVDVGGSGVKGAPVDLDGGTYAADRHKVATPQPATPQAVARSIREVVDHHGWTGPIGLCVPAVVQGGRAITAANIDDSWIGTDVAEVVRAEAGLEARVVLNDADAAGLAEMRFGVGKGRRGSVLVLTLGTGIGSVLFSDGRLVPNTELGHLQLGGWPDAEVFCAPSARKREPDLSWEDWASQRLSPYLQHVEQLIWPDLVVLGGGVSRKPEKWLHAVRCRTEVVTAELTNDAGIVGAALAAEESTGQIGEMPQA